jgi:ATP-dependent Lon protease
MPIITEGSFEPYISYENDVLRVGGGYKNLSELAREAFSGTDYTEQKTAAVVEEVEPIAPVEVAEAEELTEATDLEPEIEEANETLQNILEMRRDRIEERQANREEAYERLAAKHLRESDQRYQSAREIGSVIPFGQPILVGHHSEKRHRRDIERIDTNMRKSIEHQKTAEYYQGKLAAMESNTAISSDDPDALEKLKAKLDGMEESQEYMKRINGCIRKLVKLGITTEEKIKKLVESETISIPTAASLLTPDFCGRLGYADYRLQNNNANMRRVRERIAEIESQHKAIAEHGEAVDTEYEDLGLKVVMNLAANRIQFVFDGKPSEQIRSELKSNGFRWSPREGAWQRQLNNGSKSVADRMIKTLQAVKSS